MATANENISRDYELGEQNQIGVKANSVLFEGSAVGSSAGLARSLVKGDIFLGFAKRKASNNDGANGEINVDLVSQGRIVLPVGNLGDADLGKEVYASSDMTFTLTASGNTKIGKVLRVIGGGEAVVSFNAGV